MDRAVKYRNLFVQIILMAVTLGIYAIYWFYVTGDEMKSLAKDGQASPGLWTILLFIPIANLYACYKHAELFQKVSTEHFNPWILFVLWLVFSPAVWFIVQTELNKHAGAAALVTPNLA